MKKLCLILSIAATIGVMVLSNQEVRDPLTPSLTVAYDIGPGPTTISKNLA